MQQPFGWRDTVLAALVFAIAAAVRVLYVVAVVQDGQQPPFQVQDPQTSITMNRREGLVGGQPTDADRLVKNIRQKNSFVGRAQMFPWGHEETTAHVAPAYPFLVGFALHWIGDEGAAARVIIWAQCALGALTAMLYMLFARQLFGSPFIGFLAGLLAAIHPFWIINVAELQDGTLACFAVACCLLLGTTAAQRGGPVVSLAFGLWLAGMALVRAALLPFAFICCCWVLLRFRKQPRSWLCALLVILGFGNGLAPWTVRNHQRFGEIVPITDSLFFHLLMGNNRLAKGGPQSDLAVWDSIKAGSQKTPRAETDEDRLDRQKIQGETNEARRDRLLADEVWQSIRADPAGTVEKRLWSGLCFTFGASWFWLPGSGMAHGNHQADLAAWVPHDISLALVYTMLVMLAFGLLGWRWSYGWKRQSSLASLAIIWIPLPYILSHAELYSGPRLPLDGVLLCYAAFALTWIVPVGRRFALPAPDSQ